jgi:hypothetical protein
MGDSSAVNTLPVTGEDGAQIYSSDKAREAHAAKPTSKCEVLRKVFLYTHHSIRRMSQQGRTEHVCAFCMLVIQIDIAKVAAHMRIAHGLKRYEIPA